MQPEPPLARELFIPMYSWDVQPLAKKRRFNFTATVSEPISIAPSPPPVHLMQISIDGDRRRKLVGDWSKTRGG